MALFSPGPSSRQFQDLQGRVHRLEVLLASLARAGEVDGDALLAARAGGDAVARELKARGEAIAAIKLVRQRTGLGLRDAKAVVDEL